MASTSSATRTFRFQAAPCCHGQEPGNPCDFEATITVDLRALPSKDGLREEWEKSGRKVIIADVSSDPERLCELIAEKVQKCRGIEGFLVDLLCPCSLGCDLPEETRQALNKLFD